MQPNINPDQMKQASSMIDGMNDEQLKAAAQQAGAFNPMMANMDPNMMRQASNMMKNMSPEQMAQMQKMAAGMMGGGGMPGGMGGMPPMGGMAPPPTQPQRPVGAMQLPPAQAQDLAKAEGFKTEANNLFKAQKLEDACVKYFSAINTIRLNQDLRDTKVAKECEMACRSNLALCKLNMKEFDHVVDQCEKVLDYDPKNVKASYRMAQAVFALSEGKSASQVKSAMKFATIAHEGMKTDAKVTEFFTQVKAKHDEILEGEKKKQAEEEIKVAKKNAAEEQEKAQKAKEEAPKKGSLEDKLLSNISFGEESKEEAPPVETDKKLPNIVTKPDEEPVIETAAPPQPAPQPQAAPQVNANVFNNQSHQNIKDNYDRLSNMDDAQLKNMVDSMKQNRDMVRMQYKMNSGVELSDAQLDSVMNMMSPEMLKQASQMVKSNPDLINQAATQMKNNPTGFIPPAGMPTAAPTPAPTPTTTAPSTPTPTTPASAASTANSEEPVIEEIEDLGFSSSAFKHDQSQPATPPQMQVPPGMNPQMADMMNNPMMKDMMNNPEMIKMAQQMMGGMGGAPGQPGAGAGGMDPNAMQDLMKNPSMGKLLDNPEMLQNMVNMLKNPMAKQQVEQMTAQSGMSADTMIYMAEWMVSCAFFYKRFKWIWETALIRYGIIMVVLAYLLKWFGFTEGLFFMKIFK